MSLGGSLLANLQETSRVWEFSHEFEMVQPNWTCSNHCTTTKEQRLNRCGISI